MHFTPLITINNQSINMLMVLLNHRMHILKKSNELRSTFTLIISSVLSAVGLIAVTFF